MPDRYDPITAEQAHEIIEAVVYNAIIDAFPDTAYLRDTNEHGREMPRAILAGIITDALTAKLTRSRIDVHDRDANA